ncbi:phosphoadenosine phosphosulfate reductase domain-containing protein [Chitinophaga japonensis]|uniref:Phosphoadenosine phosphosulfate reductase family protein n=1 Tax=Chitinophaga japonensis TaxID=104662 RepID=A0A562SYT9_CHIJA|nr:phosphoadenosine phosphosulfate reductase family protein [Chitinophaga japonensis]TWI86333.1 phosphoadenosine phosphosulfate reductase family protein [Chitinophaga japonensis]
MSIELINIAINKGAKIYASVSGGKDGQAMVRSLVNWGYDIAGLIHADLGRVEWPHSIGMCERLAQEFGIPLHVVRRHDGLDMLAYWQRRMHQLKGTGKPFWSSSSNRYCTSDLKRASINKFFTGCGDFIISAEGIRAGESTARSEKAPLSLRTGKHSTYYDGMTVEEAIHAFKPGKKLALNWYPVFNFQLDDVWATYGVDDIWLEIARDEYEETGNIPDWWPFHPAYALGNDRVSCMLCVLGCIGDLRNGARHNPALLQEMIAMEEEGRATFKNKWSLKELVL